MRSLYVVKLGLVGLAGLAPLVAAPSALASPPLKQIGTSPFRPVTAVLPDAVSVTFNQPLSSSGAQMTIIGSAGADIGIGPAGTGGDAIRRGLRDGSPSGPYTVFWHVVSASGAELSGSFDFVAARGNGPASVPAPPSHPTESRPPEPTPSATPSPTPPPTPSPTTPSPTTPAPPTSTTTAPGAVVASPTPFQFLPTPTLLEPSPLGAQVPRAEVRNGPASGFMLVPITVGALLVVAAGVVSVLSRRRDKAVRAARAAGASGPPVSQ
jgi:methionine-rich copper-binding protein CopC